LKHHVIPGDPAGVMLGSAATAADIAALRTRLGVDASLPVQYVQFLDFVVQLRLGDSIFLGRTVMQALAERAPLTLQLTVLAARLATLIGVPIGVLSAVKRGSVVDQEVTAASMAGASPPSFWIGLTLIEYLAVRLHVLPVAGYGPPDAAALERLTYLIMPALALGIPNSALIIRFTRTSMLDVLQEDYVSTARAKAWRRRRKSPGYASTPRRNLRLGWSGAGKPSRICHSRPQTGARRESAIGVNRAAVRSILST
jgi:peptide/nickel transport system permease protein